MSKRWFQSVILAGMAWLLAAGPGPLWAALDDDIEAEIASMDEQSKKELLREVVAGKPAPQEVTRPAAPGTSPAYEAPEAPGPRATQAEKAQSGSTVAITRQQENHELITTGDLIYFPTPTFKVIQPEDRYPIYRSVSVARPGIPSGTAPVFEQIGKIKVLEIQGQTTLACVLAANDVIRPGDAIMLSGR